MSGKFDKPVVHLLEQLVGIRPGTVSVGFVETFRYDGRAIKDIANVSATKDRIHVSPHDKTRVNGIAKALEHGKLNAYALNPTTICVTVPPISGEQREEMAKHIRRLGEDAKVAVRSIRQAARKGADEKADKAIQKDTDAAIKQIDTLVSDKIKGL